MKRRLFAPLVLLTALALSACGGSPGGGSPGGDTPPPETDEHELSDGSTFEYTPPPQSAGKGGTATVVIDGRTYDFASEEWSSCRETVGLFAVNLDIVSVDGEAIDEDEGHLILVLPGPEGASDAVAEDVEVSVRVPDLEAGFGGITYQAGYWVDEEVTLARDGFAASGSQTLADETGQRPSVTAQIDARCTE